MLPRFLKKPAHFSFLVLSGLLFSALTALAVGQAALFLNPGSGSFLVGSTFNVSVVLDTKGASVNTVEVELLFPADKIQLANPSLEGQSIIQLWTAPPSFSNREGRIYFVGGIPSPGIVTSQGVVLTLTFRVVAPGSGQISFGKNISVLANDGRGTNVLGQKPSAFYKFSLPPPLGPEISSPTHPDQEKWYRDPNPVFVWPKSQFATAYSWSLDQDPGGVPDTTADGSDATVSFQNVKDGISYFHLRERSDGVWGGVSHYVVKIDTQPPAAFEINVSPGKRTTNRNPIFRFFTTDSLSGFDHFEMKIVPLFEKELAQGLFFETDSPYQGNFRTGRYQVIVRALDRAGNAKDGSIPMNVISAWFQFISPEGIDLIFVFIPWWIIFYLILLLVLILLLGLFIVWRKHRHHLGHAFKEDIRKMIDSLRNKFPFNKFHKSQFQNPNVK